MSKHCSHTEWERAKNERASWECGISLPTECRKEHGIETRHQRINRLRRIQMYLNEVMLCAFVLFTRGIIILWMAEHLASASTYRTELWQRQILRLCENTIFYSICWRNAMRSSPARAPSSVDRVSCQHYTLFNLQNVCSNCATAAAYLCRYSQLSSSFLQSLTLFTQHSSASL